MNAKILRWVFVPVLVVMLAALPLVSASAVTPGGMGPDDAMTAGYDWMPIVVGEQHWFAFEYDGKRDPIEIKMYAKPTEGGMFRVLTPTQAQTWRKDGKIESVGAGSSNSAVKSELYWTGEFNRAGTYYVVVEHSKLVPGTTWCKLTITGKGVTLPGSPAVYEPEVAKPLPVQGGGPDLAYGPGNWQELYEGASNWFAFTYDKHANDPMIQIKMYLKHTEGVSFKVLTEEQAAHWRKTGEMKWIGAGSKNDSLSTDLFWTGKFTTSGTYYVVVEHSKTIGDTAYGKLLITGEGVTF